MAAEMDRMTGCGFIRGLHPYLFGSLPAWEVYWPLEVCFLPLNFASGAPNGSSRLAEASGGSFERPWSRRGLLTTVSFPQTVRSLYVSGSLGVTN